ncbi:hypothetical protein KOR42_27120 [Thalassoglobus neptunius]|uniref:DUF1573 domain-containing protein n=1 Tax=Thalassoglobus neptunius TaxID=1938619 RepID=A0A5C5X0A5_9PLAN|nr:DUF1573 domain-containing protein [Thalassoglobus neptunius]TWT55585.1 hypothetical protein KOR42_27120 [Thalassoglobus neptunius]
MDERNENVSNQTRPNSILEGGLFAFALLPFVISAFAAHSSDAARPISGQVPRETLIFSQYAVDLGLVPPLETIPAHFDFRNLGDSDVRILKLEPSCGCLNPRLFDDKKVYGTGESGRFYVSVKTANEAPGPKDYNVRVSYDDGELKERIVRFRMVIPERKVTVTPAEVYFYQTHGNPDSREILVQDHRGQQLNVLRVESKSDNISAEIGERRIRGQGVEVPIRIDVPGEVAPGKETCWLKIETDDPEYRVIQVPILIWGPQDSTKSEIQPVTNESPSEVSDRLSVQPANYDQPDSKSSAP